MTEHPLRTAEDIEQRLRQYDLIVEHQVDMVVVFDPECRLSFVSPSIERNFGIRQEDVLGKSFVPFVHEEDRAAVLASLESLRVPPHRGTIVAREHTADGIRWFEWCNVAMVNDQGDIIEAIGVGRDVTAHRDSEEVRREMERRFQELAEDIPLCLFREDSSAEGRFLRGNRATRELFGFDSDAQSRETSVASLFADPEDYRRYRETVLSTSGISGYEVALKRLDGTALHGRITACLVREPGETPYFEGQIEDVSEQKRAEEGLKRRDRILGAVSYAAECFLRTGDWQGEIQEALRRLGEAAECSRTYLFEAYRGPGGEYRMSQRYEWCGPEVTPQIDNPGLQDVPMIEAGAGRWLETFLAGDTIAGHVREFPESEQAPLRAQGIASLLAVPVFAGDRWWDFLGLDACTSERCWPPHEADALRTAASAIGAAVERGTAEEARRPIDTALRRSADAILIADAARRVTYANDAYFRHTGHARGSVIGQAPAFLAQAGDAVFSGEEWRGQLAVPRADGAVRQMAVSVYPSPHASGRPGDFVIIMRDITREQQLEAQLQQSQKMEALGALAGGIAHDFGNTLSAIMGWVEMARDQQESGSFGETCLERADAAIHRASDLVKRIMGFSRRRAGARERMDLAAAAEEMQAIIESVRPATVTLDTSLAPAAVVADPAQMHQVMLNLVTNALQAMGPGGGVLRIDVCPCEVDPGSPEAERIHAAGAFGRIRISDTGPGMTPEVREHVFEPFFTTREQDGGTGLGLPTVHGILRAHDGAVTVDSSPGEGTVFSAYIPLADSLTGADADRRPVEARSACGSARVLFVDDEAHVRAMAQMGLSALGYTVVTCASGAEALSRLNEEGGSFDVVVTDHMMPGMTGQALARAIDQRFAPLPVILTTADQDCLDKAALGGSPFARAVAKPAGPRTFADAIEAVLPRRG